MWRKGSFSLCGDEMFHQAQPGGGVIVRPNSPCSGRGPQRGAAELSPLDASVRTVCY